MNCIIILQDVQIVSTLLLNMTLLLYEHCNNVTFKTTLRKIIDHFEPCLADAAESSSAVMVTSLFSSWRLPCNGSDDNDDDDDDDGVYSDGNDVGNNGSELEDEGY